MTWTDSDVQSYLHRLAREGIQRAGEGLGKDEAQQAGKGQKTKAGGMKTVQDAREFVAAAVMSEDDLLACVIDCAHLYGWRVAHFRPAKTDRGWRTPVSADGAGFPDLILARKGELLAIECKAQNGRLSDAQVLWGQAFGAAFRVYRPSDWRDGMVERELKGERE